MPSENPYKIRRPVIAMIGGFLGAGKTTLIRAAAAKLESRGLRAAALFNDQGAELVDTQYAKHGGIQADQIGGGCFCCRFSELIEAAERLRAHGPDIIFAEAVGSCADISATVLQPLKLHFAHEFRLAPYTVMIDPQTAREASGADSDPELSFLFEKQIAEADIVCFNKSDLYSELPSISSIPSYYMSALTGQGVEAWLNDVLMGQLQVGGKLLEIDYNIYARAEAKLAWLNCSLRFTPGEALSPAMVVGPFLDGLDAALTANELKIVHLKVLEDCDSGYIKASIQRNGDEPSVEGMLSASGCLRHQLLLNARVSASPALLESIVRHELSKLPGDVEIHALHCFSPSPPRPEHRFDTVVKSTERAEGRSGERDV